MTAPPDADDAVVGALLVEYGSLREESLAAIEHRMTATNFTFAALAVIIGALLGADIDAAVAGALLVLVVPQLAKAGLLIWLGEYARSQRAGRHVARIEERVNDLLGGDVLTWESRLTSTRVHMSYPYWAVAGLLLGTGWVATALGLFLVAEAAWEHSPGLAWALVAPALVAVLAWEWWFRRYFLDNWRAARTG